MRTRASVTRSLMIVGYHVIFATYGFWLPNDPRGSWSRFVGSWELLRYGRATKTTERRSLAHRGHDRELRRSAKLALNDSPVQFSGLQARAVGRGIKRYVDKSALRVWACAILPDHVHLVVGNPQMPIERVVIKLKAAATQQLLEEAMHPRMNIASADERVLKCFVRGQWKVFLDHDDLPRAIRYVEQNPIKERKPKQVWSFVTPLPENRVRHG